MTDRNVQFPNRYQLVKVPGTDDIYDLTPAPGTITAEGTMINKSTLLQDATAALYGLGKDAVPDNIFSLLKPLIDSIQNTANNAAIAEYGTYTGTESSTVSLTFSAQPKAVFVNTMTPNLGDTGSAWALFLVYNAASGTSFHGQSGGGSVYKLEPISWSENSVSWKGSNPGQAVNISGIQYCYAAII